MLSVCVCALNARHATSLLEQLQAEQAAKTAQSDCDASKQSKLRAEEEVGSLRSANRPANRSAHRSANRLPLLEQAGRALEVAKAAKEKALESDAEVEKLRQKPPDGNTARCYDTLRRVMPLNVGPMSGPNMPCCVCFQAPGSGQPTCKDAADHGRCRRKSCFGKG